MKSFIHPQTSTIALLKFGNGWIISSQTLLGIWLLIHVEIKVKMIYNFSSCSGRCHWEYDSLSMLKLKLKVLCNFSSCSGRCFSLWLGWWPRHEASTRMSARERPVLSQFRNTHLAKLIIKWWNEIGTNYIVHVEACQLWLVVWSGTQQVLPN